MQDSSEPAGEQRQMQAAAVASRSRTRPWLIAAVVLIALLAGTVTWRLSTLQRQVQRPRGRFAGSTQPVGVSTIGTHDIRIILTELGTVTPLATITVQPQLSGLLTKLGFREGQMVHQGDFLAQIDPRPYQVALAQYQGQLLRDQAALREAQTDLKRYQKLQQQDSIASQTVDDQISQVQQDEGTVRLDQAQVDAQKLNLTYCHVTSPVTGRVGIRLVDPGNYVQSTSTGGIVVVTQLDPISVIFTAAEDFVPTVLKQFDSGKPLQVIAYDRANVTPLATGTLSAVDTQIDTTTGTVKMRAMFDNAGDALYPNQFVNVRLLIDVLHDVVTVPKAAVQYGPSGPFVYALGPDDTVKVRALQLGAQDGDLVAVQSGLSVGDRVVTDGTDQLRDNTRVSIRSDNVPGYPTGAATPGATMPEAAAPRATGPGANPRGRGRGRHGHRRTPPASPVPPGD